MKNILTILNRIEAEKDPFDGVYFIPEAWKPKGFTSYRKYKHKIGEINVNPYEFIAWCIRKEVMANPAKIREEDKVGINLAEKVIYGMFSRVFTAWDHYDKGEICYGTWLKSICLLPYLKSLHIDIIYLLPVFQVSEKYKKGDSGSPYAIKNIYRLDENLHDKLLGEVDATLIETEFKAFIEACHILGMRVILDFAFRTVARDNDLIAAHPDWFYWIDLKYSKNFTVPVIENIPKPVTVNEKTVNFLYQSKGLNDYLSQFTFSPRIMDKKKWEKLVQLHRKTGRNILEMIENEFGITTVPGFSDVINDNQPLWSDITYLRFFYDNHPKAMEYVNESIPPYIMQDGVCLRLNCGKKENRVLRKYITDVIPYYRDTFGIDGARIDMGHALSADLNKEIIAKTKAGNPGFILWSEELFPERAVSAVKDGFQFISGNIWSIYKDFNKPGFGKKLLDNILMDAAIPMTAALETPDTPRAAHVHRNRKRLKQLALINCFLPNTVPYINNGQELLEIQPMNLGLDNTNEGRFVLEKEDPMYGRLAFFDHYRLHWAPPKWMWMKMLLMDALSIREEYSAILSKKENCILPGIALESHPLLWFGYYDHNKRNGLFLIVNKSLKDFAKMNLSTICHDEILSHRCVKLIYAKGKRCSQIISLEEEMIVEPGDVIIGSIGN